MSSSPGETDATPKPPPRSVWGKTPLSGKILSVVIVAGLGWLSTPARADRTLGISATIALIVVAILAGLDLVGTLDAKGRKLPSTLSLVVAVLLLSGVASMLISGLGIRPPTPPVAPSQAPIVSTEFGFQLASPGPGWRLMDRKELQKSGY